MLDWRLVAEFDKGSQLNPAKVAIMAQQHIGKLPVDLHVSDEGRKLFVYANDERSLGAVRRVVNQIMARSGMSASVTLSNWDIELTCWRQTDPPPPAALTQAEDHVKRNSAQLETQTMTVHAGRLVQQQFEASMLDQASRLGLECAIATRRHIFTSSLAFTVTGAARNVQAFARALVAECQATARRHREALGPPP